MGVSAGVSVPVLRDDPSVSTGGPAAADAADTTASVAAAAAASVVAAAAAASADSPDYLPTQGVNAPAAAWGWVGPHACGQPEYPHTPAASSSWRTL